jgi:hypothetical protein
MIPEEDVVNEISPGMDHCITESSGFPAVEVGGTPDEYDTNLEQHE